MKKVSKGFFLGSVVFGLGIGLVLAIIGTMEARKANLSDLLAIRSVALLFMLYGAMANGILFYKMWKAIQDGFARTTPGRAIALSLIPLFGFYWVFQLLWGFSKDYNAYIARHNIQTRKLPEDLFLVCCILIATGWIPHVGIFLVTANFFVGLVMVSRICDAINALSAGETRA
jgi:hypothetical protein